uniref:Nucleotide-diphospho-sugar transferase domain-containing protein n=1 Tax=Oryza brachyantha TaxID=4533 RepID=J3L788_ORYBR
MTRRSPLGEGETGVNEARGGVLVVSPSVPPFRSIGVISILRLRVTVSNNQPGCAAVLRHWQAASQFPPDNDQGIFNAIERELAGGELNVKIVFLDTALSVRFCQYHDDVVDRCA